VPAAFSSLTLRSIFLVARFWLAIPPEAGDLRQEIAVSHECKQPNMRVIGLLNRRVEVVILLVTVFGAVCTAFCKTKISIT
jgi:hypothetical protein